MTLPYAESEPLRSSRNPWTRRFLMLVRALSMAAGGTAILAVLVGSSFVLGGKVGVAYMFSLGMIGVLAIAQMRRGLHRRRVAAIFSYCARGMRLSLPLDAFLHAAGDSERGVLRRRLLAVARGVAGGQRIDRALADCLPELDVRQAQLLSDAEPTGATVEVLDRLVAEHAASTSRPMEGLDGAIIYASVTIVVASVVSWYLIIMAFPKLGQIQVDFGVPPFRGAIQDSPTIVTLVGACFIGVVLTFFLRSVDWLTRVHSTAESSPRGLRLLPRALSRAARDQSLADFYLAAAHAVEAGQPLTSLAMAVSPARRGASPMAAELIADLGSGSSLASAARRSSLPRGDVAVLSTAVGADDLARGLRFLAGARIRSRDAARRWMSNIVSLLMTLVVAAITVNLLISVWTPMLMILDETQRQALGVRR